MFRDPVCGKHINRNKAHIVVEYERIAYFLCCPLCQAEFERLPEKYAQPDLGEKVRPTNHYSRQRQRH